MIFIADFIACSTCFRHYYAHHQTNRTHNHQLHTIPTTWKPKHQIPQAATICIILSSSWWCAQWCPKHVEQAIRSAIKSSVASTWHFICTYFYSLLQRNTWTIRGNREDVSVAKSNLTSSGILQQVQIHFRSTETDNHSLLNKTQTKYSKFYANVYFPSNVIAEFWKKCNFFG